MLILHKHLRELFSDGRKLWQAIERLVSLSLTINVEELDGMETYICVIGVSSVLVRSEWVTLDS